MNVPKSTVCSAMLAAALLLPPAAFASDAPVLPDGTYHYELRVGGNVLGTTDVTVARSGATLALRESAKYGPALVSTVTTADAATLATSAYDATYPSSDGANVRRTLAFKDQTATVSGDGLAATKTLALLDGSHAFVVLDQAFASGFVLLPAQMRAGTALLTGAAPTSGVRFPVRREDPVKERPAGTPARDVALTVKVASVDVTLWYDPATFVLDEMDAPAQQLVLHRV
jgi:hypothetical protein